jgi:peptidoglycan/LPS O-acetylase OafA/YrhL
MNRIRELDGLRFFAIAGVLLVHYRPSYSPNLDFLSIGWMGVELFFAISGFLITSILVSLRGTPNPFGVFYWRRTLRIFPPYYLVLFIICGLQLIQHNHLPIIQTLKNFAFIGFFNPRTVYHSILSPWHGALWNSQPIPLDHPLFTGWDQGFGVYWSLSIEELFYLVWAPIILMCTRRQVLALSLSVIVLSPLLRLACHSPGYREYFIPLCRFDTLMMGSVLSLIFAASSREEVRRSTLNRGLAAAAVVSLLCLVPLLVHDGLLSHMEPRSTPSFALFGFSLLGIFLTSVVGLCVTHAGTTFWPVRLLRTAPLVYIGTVSYVIYLIHIPVWVAGYKLFSQLAGQEPAPGLLFASLSAGATVSLAALSWRFFEKPILRFKNSRFLTSGAVPANEEKLVRARTH